jgi:hypothetical protein
MSTTISANRACASKVELVIQCKRSTAIPLRTQIQAAKTKTSPVWTKLRRAPVVCITGSVHPTNVQIALKWCMGLTLRRIVGRGRVLSGHFAEKLSWFCEEGATQGWCNYINANGHHTTHSSLSSRLFVVLCCVLSNCVIVLCVGDIQLCSCILAVYHIHIRQYLL